MKAKFEVEEVHGLNNPQTIVRTTTGSDTFYTGDEAGKIATWERMPTGEYRLKTTEAFFPEPLPNSNGPNQYGRSVELSLSDSRSLRLAASQAFSSNSGAGIASAGDRTYFTDPAGKEVRFSSGASALQVGPSIPAFQITSGRRGAFTNQDFEIDTAFVGIATNGTFVFAGAPAADRKVDGNPPRIINGNPVVDHGDDVGAVVIYKIATDGTLAVHQVIAASTDLTVFDREFGATIAMDGTLAAIPYVEAPVLVRFRCGYTTRQMTYGNSGNP